MAVRVTLAGTVGVEVGGVAAGGLSHLAGTAFAYLVCERHRPVSREELAELLWGDELPRSWGQLLRGIMSKVRAILASAGLDPAEALAAGTGAWQLRLPADATVDIEEAAAALAAACTASPGDAFELASAAVEIASRQFLPGGTGLWVERRQVDLRDLHLRGLEALAEAAEARGQWTAAVAAAEEAVAMEPFRESAHLRLMSVHRHAGNRGEALRAYERCRRFLAHELGVSPSPPTEAAYVALLGDEPATGAPSVGPIAPLPLPPSLAPVAGAFLVGREKEMARLADALDRAFTGRHRTVLVAGEPGVGKTTLVAALARTAHAAGARVLYGRCDEELGVAYQPFAEALGQLVTACPLAELSAHAATHGAELSRLTPELARRLPGLATPPTTDPEVGRFRMFEAVAGLLAAASRVAPVVLVVDDLHWATNACLLLLRHLVSAAAPAAVLVLGTYRHSEVGPTHPLTATLAALRRDPDVDRMVLDGLDRDGVGSYVEAAAGRSNGGEQAALAEAIHAHTAGNPFFVGELLRHLAETGAVYRKEGPWSYYADAEGLSVPEGVREVVARRVQHLSEPAGRALLWASAIGAQFDLDVLESVADPADAARVLDALEEAVGSRLVVEVGLGRYRFAHALVRDSIYSGLTATRRARLHYRVGEALEALPGDPAPRAAALAYHFAAAASPVGALRAADYAVTAARQAFAQASWQDAIAFLERGLEALELNHPADLERRCDMLLLLTESWVRLWDPAQATKASLEAVEAARALGSPERLARAARWYYTVARGPQVDDALAEEALVGLGDTMPGLRALVLARLSMSRYGSAPELADASSRKALALARQSGDREALGVALLVRCASLAGSVHAEQYLAVAEELVCGAPPDGWDGWRSGLSQRAMARLKTGDRAGFDADAEAVERLGAERRFWAIRIFGLLWRVTRALLDGRFDEVEAQAREVLDVGGEMQPGSNGPYVIQSFKLHFELGQLDRCKADVGQAVVEQPAEPVVRSMLALAHAALGETDDARREFDALAANGFDPVPRELWPVTLAYLGEVAAVLGDGERAAPVYDGLAPYRGQVVASGVVAHCPGAVDRYLGQLAATLGRFDDAEAYYEGAIALESGLRAPPLVARTEYWYARMLLDRNRAGDAERAGELLDHSLETAERLGMAGLADQLRQLPVPA